MQKHPIISLLLRDLDRLRDNIKSYEQDDILWKTGKEISNSAGHLCLHLCGNLQHFLGHIILNTDYIRDRTYEFEGGPETKDQLYAKINDTKKVIEALGEKLTEDMLHEEYPLDVMGYKMNLGYFLNHLYGHFNYHMGQINYHRRLLS